MGTMDAIDEALLTTNLGSLGNYVYQFNLSLFDYLGSTEVAINYFNQKKQGHFCDQKITSSVNEPRYRFLIGDFAENV
jgi:hypothetical protein